MNLFLQPLNLTSTSALPELGFLQAETLGWTCVCACVYLVRQCSQDPPLWGGEGDRTGKERHLTVFDRQAREPCECKGYQSVFKPGSQVKSGMSQDSGGSTASIDMRDFQKTMQDWLCTWTCFSDRIQERSLDWWYGLECFQPRDGSSRLEFQKVNTVYCRKYIDFLWQKAIH